MKKQLMQTMAAATLAVGSISVTYAAVEVEQKSIQTLLKRYEQVLNASDVGGVVKLYREDGVFMAQHNPSAVGIKSIQTAYEAVFRAIDLDITFDIIEILVIAEGWAFARTNSVGTTTINATGDRVAEGNQELFVLQKADDGWKIARYSFSTTQPR